MINRRDFMGIVAGSIAMSKLGVANPYEFDAGTGGGRVDSQGSWVKDGLIDAGGVHEPLIFVKRCGGQRHDAQQIYEHQQSEEVIRRLRDQGVEVFHTHLYKGFGMMA